MQFFIFLNIWITSASEITYDWTYDSGRVVPSHVAFHPDFLTSTDWVIFFDNYLMSQKASQVTSTTFSQDLSCLTLCQQYHFMSHTSQAVNHPPIKLYSSFITWYSQMVLRSRASLISFVIVPSWLWAPSTRHANLPSSCRHRPSVRKCQHEKRLNCLAKFSSVHGETWALKEAGWRRTER